MNRFDTNSPKISARRDFVAGGAGGAITQIEESACGWCKDKWGISWQITPLALTEGMADRDPATRARVFAAMMTMRKIDIAAIAAARNGSA